jgi:hypothetical protein
MELAQDRVQWQALVLAVLNLRVLLPDNCIIFSQFGQAHTTVVFLKTKVFFCKYN